MAVTSMANSSIVNYNKSNSMNPAVTVLPFSVEYVVVAGGGSGGRFDTRASDFSGGGGAGGYRSNVSGESSGGGDSAESALIKDVGDSFTVTVGAGGSSASLSAWTSGSNSVFDTITSIGGGYAGGITNVPSWRAAAVGGSGGGAGEGASLAAGTSGQGFAGGSQATNRGGGGGGAGEAGNTDGRPSGGDGVASSITGSAVFRAGGGAGYTGGTGGEGGGGGQATSGTANTGGGGGAWNYNQAGLGNGGSGVVLLKYPATRSLSIGAGLTSTTATVGDYKVTTFTAGTDTVEFE